MMDLFTVESETPNFGYTRDVYWARWRLHNPSPATRLIFEFRGLITRVEIVDPTGQTFASGISIGLDRNAPMSRFPAFVTDVPTGDSVYFFRNHTASKQFPLRSHAVAGFSEQNYFDVFLLTLCCGLILRLVLY